MAKSFEFQVLYIEKTSRSLKETPFYVNAKQYERILKRRVARQRLGARSRCALGNRRLYLHESRHKHAMRRSREPRDKFLNKDELKRQRRKMQKCLTNRAQNPKTRIGSNTNRINVERTNSLVALLKDVIRNNNQDNKINKLEAQQSSNTHSEP